MTNLIPVWKEPTLPPPPPPRLSSKPAYKHRSCHPNSHGPRRTCHRASHMFFLWANSGPRGQRIPLCILSHSAAVGAAPEPPPPKPTSTTDPPCHVWPSGEGHLLQQNHFILLWLLKQVVKMQKRKSYFFFFFGGGGLEGGGVKHRVLMGNKGESRVSRIVLNVVTVKRWVEELWRPFSTQQTHVYPSQPPPPERVVTR